MEVVCFAIYWGKLQYDCLQYSECPDLCRSGLSFNGNVDPFFTVKLGYHLNIFYKY